MTIIWDMKVVIIILLFNLLINCFADEFDDVYGISHDGVVMDNKYVLYFL